MPSEPKTARGGWRIDTLAAQLRERLDNEAAVVDVLVVALGKGQSHPELWALLHEAARRDERLAELAFVYERITSERRFRVLPPAAQSELSMHVAAFFAEDF